MVNERSNGCLTESSLQNCETSLILHHKKCRSKLLPGWINWQLHDMREPDSFWVVLPAFPSCLQHSCPSSKHHFNTRLRPKAGRCKSPSPPPIPFKDKENFPRSSQQPHWAICITCLCGNPPLASSTGGDVLLHQSAFSTTPYAGERPGS